MDRTGKAGSDGQGEVWQGQARRRMMQAEVQNELVAIYERSGALNPEDVVTVARDKDSALHDCFQWDNSKAAHQFRLDQARRLIRVAVTVIPALSNTPVKQFVSLSPLRGTEEGSYISTVDILSDEEKYDMAKRDAIRGLERLHSQYSYISELGPVWAAIDRSLAKVKKAA
jgi:hypothetical protein